MGLWMNEVLAQKGFDWLSTTGHKIIINTSHQPQTKAEATSTGNLMAISTDLDFAAIAASTLSGRKLPIAKTTDITPKGSSGTSAGVARHISIISGTTLVYVTQCTTRSLTTNDTVTISSWAIHILDPSSST